VQVTVTDGGALTDVQDIAVSVTDVAGLVIVGTAAPETLVGSPEPDDITGSGGNDDLDGLGGSDNYFWVPGDGSDDMIDDTGIAGIDIFIYDASALGTGVTIDISQDLSGNVIFEQTAGTGVGKITMSGIEELVITGSPGVDVVDVGDLSNTTILTDDTIEFIGLGGDDVWDSGGNDKLLEATGGGGDDMLTAGTNVADVAIFSGNRSEYIVNFVSGTEYTVAHITPTASGGLADGTDTLFNFEFLRFADTPVDIDINSPASCPKIT